MESRKEGKKPRNLDAEAPAPLGLRIINTNHIAVDRKSTMTMATNIAVEPFKPMTSW